MTTYKTGLARFLGNQRMRIEARLRGSFRTYPGTVAAGGLSERNWQSLDMDGMDDMPSSYVSRGELVTATDFEYRR